MLCVWNLYRPLRPSAVKVSETFGPSNLVITHFELKCMRIDFFIYYWKAVFFSKGEAVTAVMCYSVPGGALTRQSGCQFLQAPLFWSTLKLGHDFIFNSAFRNSSYDTIWQKHQRNRWHFFMNHLNMLMTRWPWESGKMTKKKPRGMVRLK